MTWQACFERYHYQPLIIDNTDGNRSLEIVMFLQENKVPDELRQIYLSKSRDEMFIILQPKPKTNIEDFCNRYDTRIMAFINFGTLLGNGHEAIRKLQYNITQILLYTNDKTGNLPLMECPDNFSEEKSVSISRKIFVQCGANDNIDSDNRLLLPFWYEELKVESPAIDQEEKLSDLLPNTDAVTFLYNKRLKIDHRKQLSEQLNFTEEEFASVKGWLER